MMGNREEKKEKKKKEKERMRRETMRDAMYIEAEVQVQ